jgi:hypothetical protein
MRMYTMHQQETEPKLIPRMINDKNKYQRNINKQQRNTNIQFLTIL